MLLLESLCRLNCGSLYSAVTLEDLMLSSLFLSVLSFLRMGMFSCALSTLIVVLKLSRSPRSKLSNSCSLVKMCIALSFNSTTLLLKVLS